MRLIKYLLLTISLISISNTALAEDATSAPKWLDQVDLSQYENKVIYLDFWASWCAPCRKSFPWLNQMQSKYKDQGLVIIGINLDASKHKADAFLRAIPANFLVYSDPQSKLAKHYQLKGMPSGYLVNSKGEILDQHVGFKKSDTNKYEENIINKLALLKKNNQ